MNRPLQVYVAGAWVEKETRSKVWMARLRERGIIITHDWTVHEVASTVCTDAMLPDGERIKRATEDLWGVRNADLIWLLAPIERGASGAWTEFGIALGREIPIVVSGPTWQRTIFTSLAQAGYEHDDSAFDKIVNHGRSLVDSHRHNLNLRQQLKMIPPKEDFLGELSSLINKHSIENGSNTPDFILAEYMGRALANFETASKAREEWYGKSLSIDGGSGPVPVDPRVEPTLPRSF